jgi:hypothetical protein
VIRINANGELVNARPCHKCTLMLKNLGLNKVYYSMDNMINEERIRDMVSMNTSSLWKNVDRIQHSAPINNIDYYKQVLKKMPKITKRRNIEFFIKHVEEEIQQCSYDINKRRLNVYIQNILIGTIYIE